MPDFAIERTARDAGHIRICGVDEAGRGPLAGPVVAAAVILDPGQLEKPLWQKLDDSKKMTAGARDLLFGEIMATADVGVGICDVDDIDLLNILGATLRAMALAVGRLDPAPGLALIDGNRLPVLTCAAESFVKGDARSLSIAAASVIAKVTRDRIMQQLATEFRATAGSATPGMAPPNTWRRCNGSVPRRITARVSHRSGMCLRQKRTPSSDLSPCRREEQYRTPRHRHPI